MPLSVATSQASFRANSEDRIAVHQLDEGLVVAVADGAGGISGGGAAADRVLGLVAEALARRGFEPFASASWIEVLAEADKIIDGDRDCGETTAVVVAISDHAIVGASCGDSAAWITGDDGRDDLTSKQHRKRRLGTGRALPVAFERAPLAGTLVVATDGLFNYARPADLCRVVAQEDLDEAAQGLVTLVRTARSGDLIDDVAVALVRGSIPFRTK